MLELLQDTITNSWQFLRATNSDFSLFVNCTLFFHLIVYWPLCLLLLALDLTRWQPLYKYKIQKKKHLTWENYKEAIKVALTNQVIGYPFAISIFYILHSINYAPQFGDLPSFQTLLWHLPIFVIVQDFFFFWSHYAAHHKSVYKSVHKQHHKFKAPCGMACIYAHWLEHLLVNLLPLFLGPMFVQAHVAEYWLWLTIGIISTINAHSGYEFPLTGSALAHDYHHEAFNYNFSTLHFWDKIMGTYKETTFSFEDESSQKID